MTQFIIVVSPVVLYNFISLLKYCVRQYAHYKELKLLRDTGVEHAVVAKDHIEF